MYQLLFTCLVISWSCCINSEKPDEKLCDVRHWYLTLSAQGIFDGVQTTEQQRIQNDIVELMIRGQSDPSLRYIECSILQKFMIGLQKTTQEDQKTNQNKEHESQTHGNTLDGKETLAEGNDSDGSTEGNAADDKSGLEGSESDDSEIDETELDETETDDNASGEDDTGSEIPIREQSTTPDQLIDIDSYVKNVFEGNMNMEQGHQPESKSTEDPNEDIKNDAALKLTDDSYEDLNKEKAMNDQSIDNTTGSSSIINEELKKHKDASNHLPTGKVNKILPTGISNHFGVCRRQQSVPLDVFDKYVFMDPTNNYAHEDVSRERLVPFYISSSKFVLSPSNCLIQCSNKLTKENQTVNDTQNDKVIDDSTTYSDRENNSEDKTVENAREMDEIEGKSKDVESVQISTTILKEKDRNVLRDGMQGTQTDDKPTEFKDDKRENKKDVNKGVDRDNREEEKVWKENGIKNEEQLQNRDDYSKNVDVDQLEELILSKTKNYETKMQSLELVIMKLENEILIEKLNKHNHSSSMSRLENHILKLENELLKMNQTYYELKYDNELLKKRQRRYLELGHHSDNTTKPQNEMITEQHAKISQLSQLLRNQSKEIIDMKSRSEYLEDQNRMLYQMVMNQTALMSQIMMRVQELSEQNIKQREEAQTLREEIQTRNMVKSKEEEHKELKDLSNKMLHDIDKIVSDTKLEYKEERVPTEDVVEKEDTKESACTYKSQKKWCFSDVMCVCNAIIYSWCPPYGAVFWTECGAIYHRKVRKEDEFGPYTKEVVTGDAQSGDVVNDSADNLPDAMTVLDGKHGDSGLHQHLLADSDLNGSKQTKQEDEPNFQSDMKQSDNTQKENNMRHSKDENLVKEMEIDIHAPDTSNSEQYQLNKITEGSGIIDKPGEYQQPSQQQTTSKDAVESTNVTQQTVDTKLVNNVSIDNKNYANVNSQGKNTMTVSQQTENTKTVSQQTENTKTVSQQTENTKTVSQQTENAKTVHQLDNNANSFNRQVDSTKTFNQEDDNTKAVKQQVDKTNTVNPPNDNDGIMNQQTENTKLVSRQEDMKTLEKAVTQQVDNAKNVNPQVHNNENVNQQSDNTKTVNQQNVNQQIDDTKIVNKPLNQQIVDTKTANKQDDDTKTPSKSVETNQQAKLPKASNDKVVNVKTAEQSEGKNANDKPVNNQQTVPNQKSGDSQGLKQKTKPKRIAPKYAGISAQTEPKDCYDIYLQGKRRNAVYKIRPYGQKTKIEVFCDMKNGGWTIIHKRQDGTTNFFREWDDYKQGFGGVYGEHWIGNDVLHLLTNQDLYMLRVDLMDWDKQSRVAMYEYFLVEDEQQGYKLHVDGYSGDAGDAMNKHNGQKFSTKDVDNDKVTKEFGGSCANRFNGAGWYYKCYQNNLNGKFYRNGQIPDKKYDGITWKPWRGANYSMKQTEMKIRPLSALTKNV